MECMHGVHGVPRGARGPLSVKEFRYEDKNLGKVEKTQEMGIYYQRWHNGRQQQQQQH